MSRIATAIAVAALSSGCLVSVDYDASEFQCATGGICPDGFECVATRCVLTGSLDAGTDASVDLTLPAFASAAAVPGLSANGATDDDLSLSDDLLIAVFNSDRGGVADLWTSVRSSSTSAFPNPVRIAELSSVSSESTPVISQDGLSIIFASNRSGGLGNMDIYKSARSSVGALWNAPTAISELNSTSDDFISWVSPDELEVIIHSNRVAANGFDLYMASRTSRALPFSNLTPLDEINTRDGELGARLLAGGRILTFHSDRSGSGDLFYANRESVDVAFGPALPLEGPNTAESEEDAFLATNLCFLTFSRSVAGGTTIFQTACLPD